MRAFFFSLLTIIGVIAAAVLIFIAWNGAGAINDEANIKEIRRSFTGLSRNEAYTRLRLMWLTPVAWYDSRHYGIVSTPLPKTLWPPNGDVEIDFGHATRKYPAGACGAYAYLVLDFQRDHVSSIHEQTVDFACL